MTRPDDDAEKKEKSRLLSIAHLLDLRRRAVEQRNQWLAKNMPAMAAHSQKVIDKVDRMLASNGHVWDD